jgi:hypothetical protein
MLLSPVALPLQQFSFSVELHKSATLASTKDPNGVDSEVEILYVPIFFWSTGENCASTTLLVTVSGPTILCAVVDHDTFCQRTRILSRVKAHFDADG